MSVINTNISALRAQSASTQANNMLGDAMERLSTGRRINSASDDDDNHHDDDDGYGEDDDEPYQGELLVQSLTLS